MVKSFMQEVKKKRKASPSAIKPGEVRNPTGINGLTNGLQPFAKRAEHLGAKYTPEQIIEMAGDKTKWRDEKGPLSHWDVTVLRRMAAMINGNQEERAEVALFLDRKEGKAVERREVRVIRSWADLTDEEVAILSGLDNSAD